MKITNTEVYGFEAALRGMRNPKNSWHLQDSKLSMFTYSEAESEYIRHSDMSSNYLYIGEKDLYLAQNLIKAGTEHYKFLRQIQVWADIEMPRYWWSEFDTYQFNSKNSCSTMHRLLNTKSPITLDQFIYCNEDKDSLLSTIDRLNEIREEWLKAKEEKDNKTMTRLLLRSKRLLPESFLQNRTVNTNYAELRNIYFQRKNHRLKEEWQDTFCKWVESLPYAKELILYK